MLRISLTYKNAQAQFVHESGPIEFGRGPQRDVPRRVLLDPSVSGDQLRIEEAPLRRLLIQNLSKRFPVWLTGGQMIVPGGQCEAPLPVRLTIGETLLKAEEGGEGTYFESMRTVERPFRPGESNFLTGLPKEEGIDAATLARWFEAVVSVQRASVSSGEFYTQTARAVVELIGLDRGLVILKRGEGWEVIAHHDAESSHTTGASFSRGVLERVCQDKRTFYQDLADDAPSASLLEISAVVAAPILNDDGEVVGVVYGARLLKPGSFKLAIRPLEAQLVQVLATAVEAGLARAESEAQASRRRIQFEQFFSTELARELDRDPSLLEGREREITILFSDIRGFSRVSEKLTPRETCQLAGDVMERLTVRVLEFKGVVVGYSGDGMLAMWNAPTDQPDHAILACKAAIAMFAELPALDDLWRERIGGPLGIGIGINTGRALVGNTGSRTKFMYGPQGHAVNLASRVEGATKHLGVPVLMTGSTHEKLRGELPARKLCRVRVAGIDGAADLYELHTGSVDAAWQSLRAAYESALAHYEQGRFAEACRTLYPLVSGPEGQYDLPSLTLVGRCIECLKTPHKSFDPVVELVQK